jgi:hypothetical protein
VRPGSGVSVFTVQEGDVLTVPSDLLLLKHAQAFFGADEAVASRLISAKICTTQDLQPSPGDFVVFETRSAIAPRRVMFLGSPHLRDFTYDEMQLFARRAIEGIAGLGVPIRTVTTTVHGTGYGLDGGESLQRLVRGFRDGLSRYPGTMIEKIVFLTREERAVRMLAAALVTAQRDDDSGGDVPSAGPAVSSLRPVNMPVPVGGEERSGVSSGPARTTSAAKKRVFVAMPFSEEFENVYEFGIYPAVRNCGFICERVDEAHFTGDILGRIKEGIETASLVIADLTEGRPNVYLEVGYAWGRGVPVIFVARKGEQLHFDVSTHRCIFYGKFSQFAKTLEELLLGIGASRYD